MIDWAAFLVVLFATLVGASLVVTLYSLGLRLLDRSTGVRRAAGVACFVVCALVVLYGVYLIIPAFHG
jgi:hypothetical protein